MGVFGLPSTPELNELLLLGVTKLLWGFLVLLVGVLGTDFLIGVLGAKELEGLLRTDLLIWLLGTDVLLMVLGTGLLLRVLGTGLLLGVLGTDGQEDIDFPTDPAVSMTPSLPRLSPRTESDIVVMEISHETNSDF